MKQQPIARGYVQNGRVMGDFSKWLLHEDQNTLFGFLFAVVLAVLFFAIAALLLWPLDRATTALRLAKGYVVFWIALSLMSGLLFAVQRVFRINIYDHANAYVISSLAVSGILQAGWSSFAALTVDGSIAGSSGWVIAILYGVGFVSCYVGYVAVSAFYTGSIYRLVNLAVALASFIVVSLWPAGGRALYGWFFDLV